MFWAETVPAAAFLVMSFFIPESPRWTALKGRRDQAQSVLGRIGGGAYAQNELAAIEASVADVPEHKAGLKELFRKRYARVLILGIFIAVFQQWCGTNVIFIYAQDVFAGAGYSISEAFLNIVVTGVANVIFTIVALQVVDRWGRRSLMLLGSGGLALIYCVMGLCFRAGGESRFLQVDQFPGRRFIQLRDNTQHEASLDFLLPLRFQYPISGAEPSSSSLVIERITAS